MKDYQIATIAMVREVGSMLNLKRDESIAHMYRQWSQMIASAGWLTPSKAAVEDFVKWATTRPCDEYEDAVVAPLEPSVRHYWVRNYRCENPDCCDGAWPIQVAHTTDTKEHWCAWCGEKCTYENDVMVCDA